LISDFSKSYLNSFSLHLLFLFVPASAFVYNPSSNSLFIQLSSNSLFIQLSSNSLFIQLSSNSLFIQLSSNSLFIEFSRLLSKERY